MLRGYFPNYYNNQWVSHTFKSILDEIDVLGLENKRYVLSSEKNFEHDVVKIFPSTGYKYFRKYLSSSVMKKLLNRKFVKSINSGDIAYFWTTSDIEIVNQIKKDKQCFFVMEMINCPQGFRSSQLRRAYLSAGIEVPPLPSEDDIRKEIEFAKKMDIIFCPNRFVIKSLCDAGVERNKCRLVNFGWSPERLGGRDIGFVNERIDKGLRFLFVGTFDVRKGAALLLDAWVDAGIKGELIIAGNIDSSIKLKYEKMLSRDDIKLLGHVSDVGNIYRSADVFILPTWEEGGPLATIEAMSQGLPCIVTPVGTAEIFDENSQAGQIVGFGSKDELIDALKLYDEDRDLMAMHGANAKIIADKYKWKNAARQRIDVLNELFD